MSYTFKILANSLFGVMMTQVERFKNFKIVKNKQKNQILILEMPLTRI